MKAYRMELYDTTDANATGRLLAAIVVPDDVAGTDPVDVLRRIGRAMTHPKPMKGIITMEER